MLKTGVKKTNLSNDTISFVRRYSVYILLVSFLNTIVFPTHSIVHHYVKSASLSCASPSNANLVEYIVEDYLEITNPAADAEETDVHDMEISLEDFDCIDYTTVAFSHGPVPENSKYFHSEEYHLFNSYLTQTTPPPEA